MDYLDYITTESERKRGQHLGQEERGTIGLANQALNPVKKALSPLLCQTSAQFLAHYAYFPCTCLIFAYILRQAFHEISPQKSRKAKGLRGVMPV